MTISILLFHYNVCFYPSLIRLSRDYVILSQINPEGGGGHDSEKEATQPLICQTQNSRSVFFGVFSSSFLQFRKSFKIDSNMLRYKQLC